MLSLLSLLSFEHLIQLNEKENMREVLHNIVTINFKSHCVYFNEDIRDKMKNLMSSKQFCYVTNKDGKKMLMPSIYLNEINDYFVKCGFEKTNEYTILLNQLYFVDDRLARKSINVSVNRLLKKINKENGNSYKFISVEFNLLHQLVLNTLVSMYIRKYSLLKLEKIN